ncbi:YqfO family protein [Neptunomonas sp. XY-337]|uniref:Nif3-like dinuclear metal center hexameric protein n=1 Tax=Neptunomonas sp. XY-337 TaxID=2561897 RepID=UPI0010A9FD67|nr:YqfO family protein [Neptunomonas sp. XY-337]
MYKLAFFVPESHRELVKEALFAAGAGRIGDYEACCWQTLGEGQFRPNEQSQPFIGQHGQLETLPEWKVEMVCSDELIKSVIAELRHTHPYEEPAFDVWRLSDF